MQNFNDKVAALRKHHEELLSRRNEPLEWGNGIYDKYKYPVVHIYPWSGSTTSTRKITPI